jgi:hypothetical protein
LFFLRVTLLELTDAMAYQAGRRVSDLIRQAYNKTTTKQARSALQYRQQLVEIKGLVDDDSRSAEARLADIGQLLEGLSAKPTASHAASVRETLTEDHHRIRNLLAPLREWSWPETATSRSCGSLRSSASCTNMVRRNCRPIAMCR